MGIFSSDEKYVTMSEGKRKMKFYICGYARHGKDIAAQLIKTYTGLKFQSSSWFCCGQFIYKALLKKYNYLNVDQCFQDRSNHRAEWHQLIRDYNKGDENRLSREIFAENDIYVGCRARQEISYDVADFMLWIDASQRLPPEDSSSINITQRDADIIIDNNGSLIDFEIKIKRFCKVLK